MALRRPEGHLIMESKRSFRCDHCNGKGLVFYCGLGPASHIGPCPICQTEKCFCGVDHKKEKEAINGRLAAESSQ